jgi:hypothetical protein
MIDSDEENTIQVEYSPELVRDLKNYHNVDAEEEIRKLILKEIAEYLENEVDIWQK